MGGREVRNEKGPGSWVLSGPRGAMNGELGLAVEDADKSMTTYVYALKSAHRAPQFSRHPQSATY
jgi:hypothetical protein